MDAAEILAHRLTRHALARPRFAKPEDVVAWFGAVQAQDYLGALWGVGQRMRSATEAKVESALDRRALIRCWPMRGTLHFVAADDARWITNLLAPRIIRRYAAFWERELDVDASVVGRARDTLRRALEGGRRLDRAMLYAALETKRIRCGAMRGQHILLRLALEGTLCLTGREGKQHRFALLDEWIPASRALERDAALAELARRYFTSHGPATLKDFMWWSGITMKDAKAAIDGAGDALARERFDGVDHWFGAARMRIAKPRAPHVLLLPAYDEYTVAYKDRSMLVAPRSRLGKGFGLLSPVIVIDGTVVGSWTRTLSKDGVRVATRLARTLTRPERAALNATVERYSEFLGTEALAG